MRTRHVAIAGIAITSIAGIIGYRVGHARADGIPTTTPLFFTGTLENGGVAVPDGPQDLTVRLWDDATAGNTQCTTVASATPVVGGRFRVALDPTCVIAIQTHPDLWVEPVLGGTSFGRTKVGAVPYAVEAARAAGASGALNSRITAIETSSGGLRTGTVVANLGTVTRQSGSWIAAVTHDSTGVMTFTIASGFFSDVPTCICSPVDGTSGCSIVNPVSATRVATRTSNDYEVSLMCTGPH